MTDHTHTTIVEGCYRCELNKDELGDLATPIGTPGETMKVSDLPVPVGRLHARRDAKDRNQQRALYAGAGITAYAEHTGVSDEALEQTIADLLGDLRHLCDAAGLDFEAVDDRGYQHYSDETHGEG